MVGDSRARNDILNYFSDHSPTASVVDDATLIAIAAIRQSVKNLILVRVLRDKTDFDDARYVGAIAHEFELFAAEKVADAARVSDLLSNARQRKGQAQHPFDYREADVGALESRENSLLSLARKLRELANDSAVSGELLTRARNDALSEIEMNLRNRIEGTTAPPRVEGADRELALLDLQRDIEESLGERDCRSPAERGLHRG